MGKFRRQVTLFICSRGSLLPSPPYGLRFLLNWYFHSTKPPLRRGSDRCAVRASGENVRLCVRRGGQGAACVSQRPCRLRPEAPGPVSPSVGCVLLIFKASWLRQLCTVREHIPPERCGKDTFVPETETTALQQRASEEGPRCSLGSVLNEWISGLTHWIGSSFRIPQCGDGR